MARLILGCVWKDRVALSQERAHLIRGTVEGVDGVRAAGVDEEANGARSRPAWSDESPKALLPLAGHTAGIESVAAGASAQASLDAPGR